MSTKRRELRVKLQEILDNGGVFSSDPELVDKLADCAISLLIVPPKPRKQNNGIAYYHLAAAIADVCRVGLASNKEMLIREARLLSKEDKPAPTPELVHEHYGENGTWYDKNFFGKKGEPPRPAQIRQTWIQYAGIDCDSAHVVRVE
jgi:hypothetical protein